MIFKLEMPDFNIFKCPLKIILWSKSTLFSMFIQFVAISLKIPSLISKSTSALPMKNF